MGVLNTWNEYHQTIAKDFFNVCSNRSVIEIGAYWGHQTQAIVKYPVKSLLLVEPDIDATEFLINKFPTATIINDDIFNVYRNKLLADVVVACGLLYHLHSPLYLLELIANQTDPEYIILDSIDLPNVKINDEMLNVSGYKHTSATWKSVKYNIIVPFDYINTSLTHLGYKCINKLDLADFKMPSKLMSWMACWQKISKEA